MGIRDYLGDISGVYLGRVFRDQAYHLTTLQITTTVYPCSSLPCLFYSVAGVISYKRLLMRMGGLITPTSE